MEIRPDILEPAVMYELLAMAVEQTADSIVVTDPKGTIIFVNPGFEVTTGYTSKEAIGQTPKLLKSGHHSEEFYKDLWGRIRSGQHFRGTILNKKRNGSLYWSEQTITPIKDKQGQITHFVSVLKDITDLIERERLEGELHAAADIQLSILPGILPKLPGIDICARLTPARYVSGDFYDVFKIGKNKVGVLIGDVSDKGIPAALFAARVHALITAEMDSASTPGEVLQRVNVHINQYKRSTQFVTVLYGILDYKTREFTYARAGHEPPLLLTPDGRVQRLPHGTGMFLGISEQITLDEKSISLPEGATLLLFTDGMTDCRNPQGQPFNLERIQLTLSNLVGLSAQEVCDGLMGALKGYQQNAQMDDDVTLVAVHVLGDK